MFVMRSQLHQLLTQQLTCVWGEITQVIVLTHEENNDPGSGQT